MAFRVRMKVFDFLASCRSFLLGACCNVNFSIVLIEYRS